jgi:hypothetical protein
VANKKNGAGLTKQDAVRRALAALGKQASAKDIQKHVKETFGFDMTIDHIYTAKSSVLAKRKKASRKPAEPEKPAVQLAPVASKMTGGITIEDVEAAKALVGRVGVEQLHQLIDVLGK